ncbi:uncharacterized protein LOC144637055 [Oculina patagonica]
MKTKLLSGCFKKQSTGIRAKDGKVITTEEDVLEGWREHFYEVLNVACEESDFPEGCQLDACKGPIEIDTSPFAIQEVRRAISRLKNGKATGVNSISAEMLKASPAIALNRLLYICNQCNRLSTSVKPRLTGGDLSWPECWGIRLSIIKNTSNTKRGLRWKLNAVLNNLDYANDIALLSRRHKDLREKCNRLHQLPRFTGLRINTTNTKVADPIFIDRQEVVDVNSFIYLGATVHGEGGSHEGITRRRRANATLNPV